MTGRIRTIKPELLEDDRTAGLSHEAWRLFVSMILLADDYGNLRANPKLLEGAVFWAYESFAGVSRIIRELVASGLVVLYEVNGQPYAHLEGWGRHQRVDKPGKARCPGPKEGTLLAEIEDSRESRENGANGSRAVPESFAPDPDPEGEGDLRSPISDPESDPDREGTSDARAREGTPEAEPEPEPEPAEPAPPTENRHRDAFTASFAQTKTAVETWDGPKPEHVARAKAAGLDVATEADRFRLNAKRSGRVVCDWDADFALWLIDSPKFKQANGAPRSGTGPPREDPEERTRRRNNLLDDASAGRYGSEVRARAKAGRHLSGLADELEAGKHKRLEIRDLTSAVGKRMP